MDVPSASDSIGTVQSTLDEQHLTIKVVGAFIFSCYPSLSQVMAEQLPQAREITFDLRETSNIDSSAVGMMLVARHQMSAGRSINVLCRSGMVLNALRRMQMHLLMTVRASD